MYSEYSNLDGQDASAPFGFLGVEREKVIRSLQRSPACDILVVGGGIHGAAFARLAALNGFRTVLLEAQDYASATSSRSSKMAHGGLRYLELFDFSQVFEGIRCREALFETAPHLVKPYPFLLPQFSNSLFQRTKYRIGLWLYDYFVRQPNRKSHTATSAELNTELFKGASQQPHSGLVYFDGIMRDTRLVQENIIAARQEGALTLNYARVDSLHHQTGRRVVVGFTDTLTNSKYEIAAGIVVNCSGPWVAQLGRLPGAKLNQHVTYSRGAHLLFARPWHGPALFLPLGGRGRFYFVWPHPGGTMVGTTEAAVAEPSWDPQPSQQEVEELLARLQKDIPAAGLNRESLYYGFAGLRTLVSDSRAHSTSDISRKPVWSFSGGVLSLLGGKFTTAMSTVQQGLQQVCELTSVSKTIAGVEKRPFPGATQNQEIAEKFRNAAHAHKLSDALIDSVLSRYGGLCKYFLDKPELLKPIGPFSIRGEIEFALQAEQAETIEDVLRRRLELELLPGAGLDVLPELKSIFQELRPQYPFDEEASRYRERIVQIQSSLKK